MKIYFDNIVFTGKNIGGISVVWYELVSRVLNNHAPEIDVSFIEYPEACQNARRKKLNLDSFPIIYQGWQKITRYLPVWIKESKPFIFHSSYFRVCLNKNARNITTVHDFTYEKNPKVSHFPNIKRMVHSMQKKFAVKHSAYIICISENTKKDLLELYPWVDSQKVVVINNGVADTFRVIKDCDGLPSVPFKKGEFLLYVGGRAKYKNYRLVVDYIKQSEMNLVVVGGPYSEEEKQLMSGYEDRIFHAGRINDEELNMLYNTAHALVYPSAYEGFGIPVLEAQRAGCPVIALNASSIPEIIGDTSLLMREESVECLDYWVKQYANTEFRAGVIKKGLENAKRFSWETMAEQVFELYRNTKC